LFGPTMSRELAKGLEITRLLLERISVIAAQRKAKVAVVLLPLIIAPRAARAVNDEWPLN